MVGRCALTILPVFYSMLQWIVVLRRCHCIVGPDPRPAPDNGAPNEIINKSVKVTGFLGYSYDETKNAYCYDRHL